MQIGGSSFVRNKENPVRNAGTILLFDELFNLENNSMKFKANFGLCWMISNMNSDKSFRYSSKGRCLIQA
jgi:hypothetical protein